MFYEAYRINIVDLKPVSVDEVVHRIQNSNTLKETIEKIYVNKHKKERNELKRKSLPYFVWANFSKNLRNNAHFKYTEFIGFDFDGDTEEAKEGAIKFKDEIIKDPRTFLAFISPSGRGVKFWFRLDNPIKSIGDYRKLFDSFKEEFKEFETYGLDFDIQVSDTSRACFYSYDPDIYYNPDCERISSEVIEEAVIVKDAQEGRTGKDAYNHSDLGYSDTVSILEDNGYEILREESDRIQMKRQDSNHNALTIFRSIKTDKGEGRIGVYLFTTSDPKLESSEARKKKGLPATYSPIELLMRFKFRNEYELNTYLQKNNFELVNSSEEFKNLSMPDQIVRILDPIYSFVYDEVSKILYASQYGRDKKMWDGLIEADIVTLLSVYQIKGSWRDSYKKVILSRMAEIINPVHDIIRKLKEYPVVLEDPIRKLMENLTINYEMLDIPYERNLDPDYIELKHKLSEGKADRLDLENYVYSKKRELIEKYVYYGLRKWFLSTVAGWVKEDTVNEIVLVFQSEKQGIGKTRFMRRMRPSFMPESYYSDELIQNGEFGKDTMLHVLSKLIINIDEMQTLRGKDLDRFKHLVSAKQLSVRVPYGVSVETSPKYTAFVGTTNESMFLGDKTGNRRYFVVPLDDINYEYDNVSIDECYAFAYQQLNRGEHHWIEDIELVTSVNRSFLWDTFDEDLITEFFVPAELDDLDVVKMTSQDVFMWTTGENPTRNKLWSKFPRALSGLKYKAKTARSKFYNNGEPKRLYYLKPIKPPVEWSKKDIIGDDNRVIQIYQDYLERTEKENVPF